MKMSLQDCRHRFQGICALSLTTMAAAVTFMLFLGAAPALAAPPAPPSFDAAVNYDSPTGPRSVITGDFNMDGKADLAEAHYISNNVAIHLGNGNGTFGAATYYATGSNPFSVTIGDFNRDGKADLATANYGSDNVSILIGVGNGTFGAATNFATGDAPSQVITGDFNADGEADLAANIARGESILY